MSTSFSIKRRDQPSSTYQFLNEGGTELSKRYPVAIYGTSALNQVISTSAASNIKFNQYTDGTQGVILKGWTFNPSTDELTCPADGLYYITCIITYRNNTNVTSNGRLLVTIKTNPTYGYEPFSYGIIKESGSNSGNNISISYIFNLSQNNKVWLTAIYDQGTGTIPIENAIITIFKIA